VIFAFWLAPGEADVYKSCFCHYSENPGAFDIIDPEAQAN
jgi:hypothetical protein